MLLKLNQSLRWEALMFYQMVELLQIMVHFMELVGHIIQIMEEQVIILNQKQVLIIKPYS